MKRKIGKFSLLDIFGLDSSRGSYCLDVSKNY